MKIGLFGPQFGLSPEQIVMVQKTLRSLKPDEVHIGSSSSGDYQLHQVVLSTKKFKNIVVHPTKDARNTIGEYKNHVVLEPKTFDNVINDIVKSSDVIIIAAEKRVKSNATHGMIWKTCQKEAKTLNMLGFDGTLIS